MAEKQYTYAVARIRSKEISMLNKQSLEQLLASKNYDECIHLLKEKGWGKSDVNTAEDMIKLEGDRMWELMEELLEDVSVFDVFLYANDYHNLKAALKQAYTNKETPNIYLSHGTVASEVIIKAVKEHEFSILPEHMRPAAEEAYQVLFRTGDGQLCDMIIDKATLEAIYKNGKLTKNDVLIGYAELKVVAANLNIAIRGCRTLKGIEFYERAMVPCDSIDIKELMKAALDSEEAIYEYIASTSYEEGVEQLKMSIPNFERWCDNLIIKHIKPQRYNPFTLSPLAAYILGKENEIKSVRILLSGKLNDLPENSIRERLRETYV